MRFFTFIIWLVLALLLNSCGNFADVKIQNVDVDYDLVDEGIQIYRSNYCGICHTLTIAHTHGTFGPNHDNLDIAAKNYTKHETYNGLATNATEYIRESISDPSIFITPGYEATHHRMPSFSHLSVDDIDALVYMLLHNSNTRTDLD